MAIEPVESGEKVTVGGNEGYVVRGVAIRGGVEYTVRVADPDSPATEPLKLPQGYNADAAYGVDDPEEYEARDKADREDRERVEKAISKEREAYTEREQKLTDEYRQNSKDDDVDVGPVGHLISAEATRQVDKERAEKSKEDSSKENQSARSTATSTPTTTNKASNAKATEEGRRNR